MTIWSRRGILAVSVDRCFAPSFTAAAADVAAWNTLPNEAVQPENDDMAFVDALHGWDGIMVGGFETRDGGASFTPAPPAQAANEFRVIALSNTSPCLCQGQRSAAPALG
jgi:hypothetical protein